MRLLSQLFVDQTNQQQPNNQKTQNENSKCIFKIYIQTPYIKYPKICQKILEKNKTKDKKMKQKQKIKP